jgi:hypothetical protein
LAAAYLSALDALGAGMAIGEWHRAELAQLASHASDLVGPEETTDSQWFALEAAEDLLGELAPKGFYFGGSEGDPACLGFHPIDWD